MFFRHFCRLRLLFVGRICNSAVEFSLFHKLTISHKLRVAHLVPLWKIQISGVSKIKKPCLPGLNPFTCQIFSREVSYTVGYFLLHDTSFRDTHYGLLTRYFLYSKFPQFYQRATTQSRSNNSWNLMIKLCGRPVKFDITNLKTSFKKLIFKCKVWIVFRAQILSVSLYQNFSGPQASRKAISKKL